MKITRHSIEVRHQGWMPIVGIVFLFLSGLFVFVIINEGASRADFVSIMCVLLFGTVGIVLTFGRAGITIDIAARTYRRRVGLFAPIWLSRHSLSGFDRVTVAREEEKRHFETIMGYHIRLSGPTENLDIEKLSSAEEARRVARRLAEALDLGLVDATGRKEIEYDAGRLGEPVRQRAQRTGALPELPEPPPDLKTQVTVERTEMILHIPPDGFTAKVLRDFCLIVLGAGFTISLSVISWPARDKEGRRVYTILPLLITGLFVLVGLASAAFWIWRRIFTRWDVHLSSKGLRVVRQGILGEKVFEIGVDEVIELNIMKREAKDQGMGSDLEDIVLRSHNQTIRFGGSLPLLEKEWIHAVIERVISA